MFCTGIINHQCVQSFSFSHLASFLFCLALCKTTLISLNMNQITLQTDRTDERHCFCTKRQNLCNGCVPHHSLPTCQQRRQCAYIAEMKLRIYHMYISRLTNKGLLSAALMFFQAAEHGFTSHYETVVNWTTAQRDWSAKISAREWEWAKGLSAAYIPAVWGVSVPADVQGSAISLLQLSDCSLLTHISARMFPFTALSPFLVQQNCATLFQFVEHRTFLPAVVVSPRSTLCVKNC